MSKIFDNSSDQAVDLSNLGTIIRERREALGLTQSRLAQLSGLSRQTLVGPVPPAPGTRHREPAATSAGFRPFASRGVVVTDEAVESLRDSEGC